MQEKTGVTAPRTLIVHIDYKGPCPYLAKDLVYDIERDLAIAMAGALADLQLADFTGTAQVAARPSSEDRLSQASFTSYIF